MTRIITAGDLTGRHVGQLVEFEHSSNGYRRITQHVAGPLRELYADSQAVQVRIDQDEPMVYLLAHTHEVVVVG